jgi:hypothetical protein
MLTFEVHGSESILLGPAAGPSAVTSTGPKDDQLLY